MVFIVLVKMYFVPVTKKKKLLFIGLLYAFLIFSFCHFDFGEKVLLLVPYLEVLYLECKNKKPFQRIHIYFYMGSL